MKIIVLDAFPLNCGDLSWDSLENLGEVTVHERTAPDEISSRIEGAAVILTNKVKISRKIIEKTPNLKFIGAMATGFDNIDAVFAEKKGIAVCNVPSYSAAFTAQTTVALMLELCHHVGKHADEVRDGKWAKSRGFSFWETPLVELDGKTLVIIGLGTIGRRVAKIAEALGMKVLAASAPGRENSSNGERIELDAAIPRADFVSLHCPLTPQTRGFVNAALLSQFQPGAFLINTARGALIEENDLANALKNGVLAGFAGDVLSIEPPNPENPLLNAPNCLITPHIGWASLESRRRCLETSIENVAAWQRGAPQNVVN